MRYFNLDQSDPEDIFTTWLLVCLAVLFSVACFVLAMKMSVGLLQYSKTIREANVTQGVLIERVRIPNKRYPADHYLRYRFENPEGLGTCEVSRDTRTTPRNLRCTVTVGRVDVSEKAYQSAVIPSSIEILYKSNETGTWSEPVKYSTRQRQIGFPIIFSILGLMSGIFAYRSAKVLRRSRRKL